MSLFDSPAPAGIVYICTLCSGSGVVAVKLNTKPIHVPFVFLCSCGTGDYRKRNFPLWPPENVNDYTVIKMERKP